jgi:hypothetical protein
MSKYAARVRRIVKRLRPMTFDNHAEWCRWWEMIDAMDCGPPSLPPPFPDDIPRTRIVRNDADRVEATKDILRRLEPHFGKRWWDVEREWVSLWRRCLRRKRNKKLPLSPPPPLPEGVPRMIFGDARDVVAAFRRAPVPGGV